MMVNALTAYAVNFSSAEKPGGQCSRRKLLTGGGIAAAWRWIKAGMPAGRLTPTRIRLPINMK